MVFAGPKRNLILSQKLLSRLLTFQPVLLYAFIPHQFGARVQKRLHFFSTLAPYRQNVSRKRSCSIHNSIVFLRMWCMHTVGAWLCQRISVFAVLCWGVDVCCVDERCWGVDVSMSCFMHPTHCWSKLGLFFISIFHCTACCMSFSYLWRLPKVKAEVLESLHSSSINLHSRVFLPSSLLFIPVEAMTGLSLFPLCFPNWTVLFRLVFQTTNQSLEVLLDRFQVERSARILSALFRAICTFSTPIRIFTKFGTEMANFAKIQNESKAGRILSKGLPAWRILWTSVYCGWFYPFLTPIS